MRESLMQADGQRENGLRYESVSAGPKRLSLVETPDGFELTWPVATEWLRWASVALSLVSAVMPVIVATSIAFRLRSIIPIEKTLGLFSPWVVGVVLWGGLGFYLLWWQRRFGHVPRTLAAHGRVLVMTWAGWWHVRQRVWQPEELKDVRLVPTKAIFGSHLVAHIIVKAHKGRSARLLVRSKEKDLLDRLEQLLARQGMPTKRCAVSWGSCCGN